MQTIILYLYKRQDEELIARLESDQFNIMHHNYLGVNKVTLQNWCMLEKTAEIK